VVVSLCGCSCGGEVGGVCDVVVCWWGGCLLFSGAFFLGCLDCGGHWGRFRGRGLMWLRGRECVWVRGCWMVGVSGMLCREAV
jgi:hypothetical protein